MSSESSRDPTDYVRRKKEGDRPSTSDSSEIGECRHEVNVIDSDRVPEVQVHSDKRVCGDTEEMSKENLRSFWRTTKIFERFRWRIQRSNVLWI